MTRKRKNYSREEKRLGWRGPNGARKGLSSSSFVGLLATQLLGAMNDSVFRWFAAPIGIPILGSGEALSLGLVDFGHPDGTCLEAAQKKIETQAVGDERADSAERWLELNCPDLSS